MKRFNTTGKCIADRHYMVPIDRQVGYAARMVEDNLYFCINRGRQYGKTTTLDFLERHLQEQGLVVFSISFESLPDSAFESLETLLAATVNMMGQPLKWMGVNNLKHPSTQMLNKIYDQHNKSIEVPAFRDLITTMCVTNRCVLIIDEVDAAGNYPEFIKFLALLREMYLKRDKWPTFQSVILAGVYDIKNLKLKMRPEDQHQYNSPWNIAAPFEADMSLHADGIATMLANYATEHGTTFDCQGVAQLIYDYTSGYPFLVSRLCQIIDEKQLTWDKEGVLAAVNNLLKEGNTLFDDLTKKLTQFSEMAAILKAILYNGERVPFNYYDKYINLAAMFNFVYENKGAVAVSCRIFETWLYNYFASEERTSEFYRKGEEYRNQFIHDGQLDMRRLIERFSVHFNETFRPGHDDRFVEREGRKLFLTYLRPVINGIGNYYTEAETRDLTRTDVIVDYLGQQYVVELKIWRGESYNERGEQQLAEYLDYYHLKTGYLVSFCFNKNKQPGLREVKVGGRTICEAIV
ncbi:MAG: AAA-like domain-containing protein [Prevotella sp.]|nr:AAA-like domain-containing protein [Prevotella sp.]